MSQNRYDKNEAVKGGLGEFIKVEKYTISIVFRSGLVPIRPVNKVELSISISEKWLHRKQESLISEYIDRCAHMRIFDPRELYDDHFFTRTRIEQFTLKSGILVFDGATFLIWKLIIPPCLPA